MLIAKLKLLAVSFFFFFSIFHSYGQTNTEYEEGRFYIKFNESVDISQVLNLFDQEYSITSMEKVFKIKDPTLALVYSLSFEKIEKSQEFMNQLNRLSIIEYCERIPIHSNFFVPNDLSLSQLSLTIIDAQGAWDISTGDPNIVIAIVDDAVRIDHEDLISNLWVNSLEVPGNGIDDDLNGYIDDLNGFDLADNDNNPSPPLNATNNSFTHGTHCAGISSAKSDNGIGMASIGSNCSLMSVKTKSNTTSGAGLSHVVEGTEYAIAAKANVISMSFGSYGSSLTYQNLIDYGHSQGIIFVAASGNNNTDISTYPASYNHVISVGATNSFDQKASFSNYGPNIDVMAPGVDIYSTLAGSSSSYGALSGTSMACPMVAGLVGLMLSKNNSLTPDEVEACLVSTCTNISSNNPSYLGQLGAGRIDANQALLCVPGITANFTVDYPHVCAGSTLNFTDLSINTPTAWAWTFSGGVPSSSSVQNPSINFPTNGNQIITLTASNSLDTSVFIDTIYIGPPTIHFDDTISMSQGFTVISQVELVGVPPFDFSYSNGTDTFAVNNVYNPYYLSFSPLDSTTYTPISVTDASCSGVASGITGAIVVNVAPLLATMCNYVTDQIKIGEGESNFQDTLDGWNPSFGYSTCAIGDLDMDGVQDMAVGARSYEDNGLTTGAIWILFLNPDGTVKDEQRISNNMGGFPSLLVGNSYFGHSIDTIGDYNNDGVVDLIVGQEGNTDGAVLQGAVWILLMNTDGTINGYHKLSSFTGNVSIPWQGFAFRFGRGVTSLEDMTGNGTNEIVVTSGKQTLHVLFMNSLGSCDSTETITSGSGGLPIFNQNENAFGYSITNGGDINNDGVSDLIVGDCSNDLWIDPAVYIVYLNPDGTVQSFTTIGAADIPLHPNSRFGYDLDIVPDLNGNGTIELLVGDPFASPATTHLIYLDSLGSVLNYITYGTNLGNFQGLIAGIGFGSSVTYLGDLNNDETLEIICSEPNHANGGVLWVVSLNQCEFECSIDANFSETANCAGDSVFFTDLSTQTDTQIDNWQWDFGDGESANGVMNPSHVYLSDGTYNVQLIASGSSGNACSDTLIQQVTINSTPSLNYTDTLQVCPFDSAEIPVALPACGEFPYTYNWNTSVGLSDSTIANPIVSITEPETFYVTVIDGFGNITTDSIFIDTIANCCMTFADFETNNNVYCLDDTIQFVNNSVSTGTAIYSWTHAGANIVSSGGNTPINLHYSSSGVYEIQLLIQDNCGQDSIIESIVVLPKPEVNLGIDTSVCVGDWIDIGVPDLYENSYLWSSGNVLVDSVSYNSISPVGNAYYVLEVEDEYGCTNVDSVLVNVYPTYDILISMDICFGDSVFIEQAYQSLSGLYTDTLLTTNLCDSIIQTQLTVLPAFPNTVLPEVEICPGDSTLVFGSYQNTAGMYYNTLQNLNGCDSIIERSVTFLPSPVVQFGTIGQDTVCINSPSINIANGSPSGGAYSGAGVSGSTLTPADCGIGNHQLYYSYTNTLGCSNIDSVSIFVDGCVGVSTLEIDPIRVFPNPFSDHVTIEFSEKNISAHNIMVYDATGRLVYFNSEFLGSSLRIYKSDLVTGFYRLIIYQKDSEEIIYSTELIVI